MFAVLQECVPSDTQECELRKLPCFNLLIGNLALVVSAEQQSFLPNTSYCCGSGFTFSKEPE